MVANPRQTRIERLIDETAGKRIVSVQRLARALGLTNDYVLKHAPKRIVFWRGGVAYMPVSALIDVAEHVSGVALTSRDLVISRSVLRHLRVCEDDELGRALQIGARIYFIAGADLIKIGVSENPTLRRDEMQNHSPVPLIILAVAAGDQALERGLHAHFSDLRAHGEWFRRSFDLDQLIHDIQRLSESGASDYLKRFLRQKSRRNPGISCK